MSKFISKVLALTLTLALALSMSAVAFAAAPGEETIEGDGDVTYIDTEIYLVSLPTDKSFNFKLDPQGLLDVDASGTNLNDLVGGKVIGGDPVKFINKSSVPVKVTAAIQAVGSDAVYATAGTTVDSGTAENVLLYMAPSKANIKTQASTDYAATENGFVLSETAKNLEFLLPAAEYKVVASSGVTGGYALEMVSDEGNGNALQLGGAINPNADWSAYVGSSASKSIKVKAVFNFVKDLTKYDASALDASEAYGLLDATAAFPVAERAAVGDIGGGGAKQTGFEAATYTFAVNETVVLPFNYNGLTIKSVTYNGSPLATTGSAHLYSFNYSANTLSLKFTSVATKTVVVTLTDGANNTTTYTITGN